MNSPLVNVTVPVFNEEKQLPDSICRLHKFLTGNCEYDFEIVIANNGSTDHTEEIGLRLSQDNPRVRLVSMAQRGRGGALRKVWTETTAVILTYMDVDLSTQLDAFLPMISSLIEGNFDLATGSRLHRSSTTRRSLRRDVISRCYNQLARLILSTEISDLQCGFKAITKDAAMRLLPVVEDNDWFFDTELLIVAERCAFRVLDIPVQWTEDSDSRVRIISTAWADFKGLLRLRRTCRTGRYNLIANRVHPIPR
jgi:glycosyltransferase involved in cell wall biosynthesis